jgi:hypothetical protein
MSASAIEKQLRRNLACSMLHTKYQGHTTAMRVIPGAEGGAEWSQSTEKRHLDEKKSYYSDT